MEKVLNVLPSGKKRGKTLPTSTDIKKEQGNTESVKGWARKRRHFLNIELLRREDEGVINSLLKTDANAGACVVKCNQNGCLQQRSTTLMGVPHERCFTLHPRLLLPGTRSQGTAFAASIYEFGYEDGKSEKQSPWMISSLILVEMWFHPSS